MNRDFLMGYGAGRSAGSGGGGGGGNFIVTIDGHWEETVGYVCTADKTAAEIYAAYEAGKIVVAELTDELFAETTAMMSVLPLVSVTLNEGSPEAFFYGSWANINPDDGQIDIYGTSVNITTAGVELQSDSITLTNT